jgi:N6-adenosine-specific RNA methylase IME4
MTTDQLNAHPAANLWPMFDEKRLGELAEDIRDNGLREPIRLLGRQVLDGRNRLAACQLVQVSPRFEQVPSDINPWAYVWSLNGARRDLAQDQRYLIWKECSEQSEAWQAEVARIKAEADQKRAAATKAQPRTEDGMRLAAKPQVVPQPVGTPAQPKVDKNKTTAAKAKTSKTNRGTVERMDMLAARRPDLAEKVKTGEMKSAAAIRAMKRAEVVAQLEDLGTRKVKAAAGLYDVIVVDPPWNMKKIERDERPNQVEFDYPPMTEAELAALQIPAAVDCHLWQWTTHRFLPTAFRLLDAWGFRYVCTFVWHKPGGFQPVGLPQFNCEFALYARKGTPKFIDTKAFSTCFSAPRGAHSAKPEELYETVRRVTAGRRLDMFNRRPIAGFDVWGNEAALGEAV